MRTALVAIALGVAAAALAGCGGDSDEQSGAAADTPLRTITIEETEYRLEPATVRLSRPGTYEFRAVNEGATDHALEIEGEGLEVETETIAPGETATLKVTLEDDRTYELYCPVGDHEDRGMTGEVVVGAGSTSFGGDGGDDGTY